LASIHWLTIHKHKVIHVLLSTHTKIDLITTSTVLRTLQAKGLIKRQQHDIDTRAKIVRLTEIGLTIIKQAIKTTESFDKIFFGTLEKNTMDFNNKLTSLLEDRNFV